MKKILWTITCVLFFAGALSACSNNGFPTGTYSYSYYFTEYRDDGTFTMWKHTDVDKIVTEGTYSVKGDVITWIQDSFCDAENAGSATYLWSADDKGLSFELIGEDLCEGRRDSCSVTWFGPK